MFAHYSSTFGSNSPRFGQWLLQTVITELTILFFDCFIQAAEYHVADSFMTARLWALTEDVRRCANERVPVLLPSKMRVDVLKRRLLRFISYCAVDQVSAILAFSHVDETDWAAPDSVG